VTTIANFTPLPVLLRQLKQYPVDRRYRARVARRVVVSALVEPLRWYENARYGPLLRTIEVHPSPVFVLGYGRSGTTHLHNLLWQDPQFGVVSNYQASMQSFALTGAGWIERLLVNMLPSTRPMDNIAITLDGPQEEEVALMNSTEHTPLHFMSFPRALPEIYDRYVTDLRDDPQRLEAWKEAYLDVVRKATILCGGKRLALKTPTNTARIPTLLEMFPGAKFINIVRNPYRVFQSMMNMYDKILEDQTHEEFDRAEIEAWTLDAYAPVMERYLKDRGRIPSESLIELRYEDLDARPLETLAQVYQELDLAPFDDVRPYFEAYLESLGKFEKNVFSFPDEVIEKVNTHWGFVFDAFGYERLETGDTLS
jgi:hypothetical protein